MMFFYCTVQLHLDGIYQKHLSKLDKLSGCLQDNSETWDTSLLNAYDVETLKQKLQQNKVQGMTLLHEIHGESPNSNAF